MNGWSKLNNTYPTLRGDNTHASASHAAEMKLSAAQSSAVKRVTIAPESAVTEVVEAEKPTVAPPREEPPPAPRPAPEAPQEVSQPYQVADVRLWIELHKWVNQKVKEVGNQRTRELISLFEGPEQALLMQVLDIYESDIDVPRKHSIPTPARPAPVPQTHSIAEDWQKHPNASKARTATYRPFGEHQELALRLIADILSADESASIAATRNGNGKH